MKYAESEPYRMFGKLEWVSSFHLILQFKGSLNDFLDYVSSTDLTVTKNGNQIKES